MLIAEFDNILNFHTSAYFTKLAISRWFGAALNGITWGFMTFCVYSFLIYVSGRADISFDISQ